MINIRNPDTMQASALYLIQLVYRYDLEQVIKSVSV